MHIYFLKCVNVLFCNLFFPFKTSFPFFPRQWVYISIQHFSWLHIFACVTHTPSSTPPPHRGEPCLLCLCSMIPLFNHSHSDLGQTFHSNRANLLLSSRNSESGPGDSWDRLAGCGDGPLWVPALCSGHILPHGAEHVCLWRERGTKQRWGMQMVVHLPSPEHC